jgi:hypothetical protein
MPTRAQVCTWIATVGLLVLAIAASQDRPSAKSWS